MKEKRKHIRLDSHLEIDYKPIALEGLQEKARSRDVSGGGLSFYVKKHVDVPEDLSVKIVLPQGDEPVFAEGKIAWFKESAQQNLAGLQFQNISKFDRARLIHWIYAQQARGSIPGLGHKPVFLKEIILEDVNELIEMLIDAADELQVGLRFLDTNVEVSSDMERIGLLGIDAAGQVAVIDVALHPDEGLLQTGLKHFEWILRNADEVKKRYAPQVDFLQRPKLFLVSSGFPEAVKARLRSLGPMQVVLVEYKVFLVPEGKKCLWLSMFQEAGAAGEKPRAKAQEEKAVSGNQSAIVETTDADEQRKKLIIWLSKRK